MTDLPRGHTANPLVNPPQPGITGPATPPCRPLPHTGLSVSQGVGGRVRVELDGANIGRWVTSVDVHYDPGHYPTATVHVLDDTPEHLIPLTGVTVVRAGSPTADIALNRPSAQDKLDEHPLGADRPREDEHLHLYNEGADVIRRSMLDAAELADQRAQDSI